MRTLAILTGHSRGLGAALVKEFLSHDTDVWGLSRSASSQAPGRVATGAGAPRLYETVVDLSDPDALLALVGSDLWHQNLASAGRILLINNAGLLTPIEPVGAQPDREVLQAVTANVAAALVLANAFVRAASSTADRRIVHISSGAGRSAYAGWNVYCATKAALDHHARSMALEQQGQQNPVRIASLAPGVIDTDMQTQIRSASAEAFPMRKRFEDLKSSGSLQTPENVAQRLRSYLFSPDFGREVVTDLQVVAPQK
jgi:NAD(P)-dependent dehydrogenase (short-subunit alcohol dehydrogenase family)